MGMRAVYNSVPPISGHERSALPLPSPRPVGPTNQSASSLSDLTLTTSGLRVPTNKRTIKAKTSYDGKCSGNICGRF